MGNGFQSFSGFGSSGVDLNTSQGLLTLAQSQGGAVSQAATELVHPNTGILSTIGNKFKNAFGDFVDLISTPSQVVAGVLSKEHTIGEAIKKNISPSDVIFGKSDPNASIYAKTGNFLVRTATDILLDPLTYLTFGAGGVLGASGRTSVILGEKAAAKVGKEAFDAAIVSKEGQKLFQYVNKLGKQAQGTTAYDIVKTGDEAMDLAGEELGHLLKNTVDAPLNENFARDVMTRVMERNPALVETLLDKGGIKYFGQTILSAQRLKSTMAMVPGMSSLDVITQQPRLAIQSLFNPNVVRDGQGVWTKIPAGLAEMSQRYRDLVSARGDKAMRSLDDAVRTFKLNDTQAQFLMAALENNMLPSDKRLADAMKFMLNYSEEDWKRLVDTGLLSSEVRLERFAPHMLVKTKPTSVAWRMPPSDATGATEMRKGARFTNSQTGETIVGFADDLGLKTSGVNDNIFIDANGVEYTRETAPIFNVQSREQFEDIEATLFKDPKKAQKMLDDMKQEGFEIFDPNLVTAWAARSLKNIKATTMREFLNDVASTFGVNAKIADERYVRINSSGVNDAVQQILGKEGEMAFHPAIAAYIEKFAGSVINDDATMEFLKAYDKLQNFWKASVTSIWPAFHGRNAISSVLQNFLDIGVNALNPRIHTMASSLIYSDRVMNKLQRQALGTGAKADAARKQIADIAERVMFTDASGYKWTFGELRQVVKNHNVAFTSRILTATDVAGGPEKIAERLFPPTTKKGKLGRLMEKPADIGQDIVGRTFEEQARLVNFIANLRHTGDVTMAAQRTKQFLFDYGHLTNFERQVMRRIVPFYTFMRKNLELQARAIVNTPGRIAAEIHAIGTLGEVLSGGQTLSDEEREALPDWVKDGVTILTKKNGDMVNILANLGTPLEQPFQMMQANVLLGSVSPLIRLPVETGAGYSFFHGKPLSEVTNATAFQRAPKVIKDLIGFTKIEGTRSDGTPYTWNVALNPNMMNFILNLPPTSRMFTTLRQMDTADVATQAKIFQATTGVKVYSFDLEAERAKKEREMKQKLEDLLTKAGVTAQFTRTYIPQSQKIEAF